jgi:hypothetical protein
VILRLTPTIRLGIHILPFIFRDSSFEPPVYLHTDLKTIHPFIMSEKMPEKLDVPASDASAPAKPSSGAESPRTGRDPDFEDDVPEATTAVPERQPTPSKGPKRVSFQDQDDQPPAPPPKPPRPMSPRAQAEATLSEAFPSIDVKVIKAVLSASGGRAEPAFHALLGMPLCFMIYAEVANVIDS